MLFTCIICLHKFTQEQISVINNYFKREVGKPKTLIPKGTSRDRAKDLTRMASNRLKEYNSAKNYFKEIAKKIEVEPSPAVDAPVEEVGVITTNELVKMRSLALSIARGQAGPNGNSTGAGFATRFAKAILDDLNSVPEGANPNYDAARAFSAALNKVYTQTSINEKEMVLADRSLKVLLLQKLTPI